MSNKAKNIVIVFLLLIIVWLTWMLMVQSYGRYCRPIIKEEKYPGKMEVPDSTKKYNSEIQK